MLDNVTAAEYFWDVACEAAGQELIYGAMAFRAPEDCPFAEYAGKAIMIHLSRDGEFHVYSFDTLDEALKSLRNAYVPRVLH